MYYRTTDASNFQSVPLKSEDGFVFKRHARSGKAEKAAGWNIISLPRINPVAMGRFLRMQKRNRFVHA